MKVIKDLIFLIFSFITVHTFPLQVNEDATVTPKINYRLPNKTIPIHYNIKLIPHIVEGNFTFDGTSSAIFEVLEPTSDVALHSRNLMIDENLTTLKYEDGTVVQPLKHNFDHITDILMLNFKDQLMPGIYTLDMTFIGILAEDLYGFYRSSYINKNGQKVWLAVTHFQPTSARRAFPCWDEPALKATFNVSIKHYSNYTALSNMPIRIVSDVDETNGKVWTHFEQTPIMSTNILAFLVADYVNITNGDGTVNIWTTKQEIENVKYFLEYAVKAKEFLEEYLNSTIRVPKLDFATVPDYSSAATENWGLITYMEMYLSYNATEGSMSKMEAAILTGVHELTHMWFGNLVSPAWWKYFWLSEGFASYFKYYIGDKIFKDWRLSDKFSLHSVRSVSLAFDKSTAVPVNRDAGSYREIRQKYGFITYNKAPALLHMLLHFIGEDVFHAGVIKYLDRHQYKAATSDDLWKAFQDALDESDKNQDGINIKKIMDTWIEQSGYPLVNVTRDYTTGETKVKQEMYNNMANDVSNNKWWIPINFATRTNPDFSSTLATNWFKPQDEEISIQGIDVDDWIIVNIQQTGFYRVNYDATNWRRIAKYLNSDDFDKIPVLNRAQLLDDAYSLILSSHLNCTILPELINYLERETDYIVWDSMFNILRRHRHHFSVPEFGNIMKPYALNLMNNLIESVGFEERSDDTHIDSSTRFLIMDWACFFDHSGCKQNATNQLIKHFEDPNLNRITPNKSNWVLYTGLRKANESIWNKVLDQYQQTQSERILEQLGYSENSTIIENYLEKVFMKDSPILEEHKFDAIYYVYKHLMNKDVTLDYIIANKEKIRSNVRDADRIFTTIIDGIITEEQYEKVSQHLRDGTPSRDEEINERESYIKLRKTQAANVLNCFNGQKRDTNE